MSSIDKEVLDIMKDEEVLSCFEDSVKFERLKLNAFCELLSEMTHLRKQFEEFNQLISMVSTDKLASFFKDIDKNLEDEVYNNCEG